VLSPQEIQQIKSMSTSQGSGGGSSGSTYATPEQAKAAFAPAQPKTDTSVLGQVGNAVKDAFTSANPILGASLNPKATWNTIADSAKSGVNQIKEGFNQSVQGSQNFDPLNMVEGAVKGTAGVVNTAMSPLAPAFKPLGDVVNAVGNKISDIPAVQNFAMSKGGEVASRVAEDTVNLDTIFGAVAGAKQATDFVNEPKTLNREFTKGDTANTMNMYDKYIKTGDYKPEQVYSDINTKTYKPEIAQQIVNDAKLNMTKLGYPDVAQKLSSIDTNSLTPEKMTSFAKQIIDTNTGLQGLKNGLLTRTGEVTPKTEVPKVMEPNPQSDKTILDSFNKGIKPSVVGKSTAKQLSDYNAKVVDAVKTIVENKNKLNITDEFGENTGNLPENPRQFGQAIEQAKQEIFNQYDTLAKSAGEQGATVKLNGVVDELNKLATDKVVSDLHPELAKYASDRATALKVRGSYTTGQAQTAVQNLNRSLESFYKNPSYETASKASVDAMIANNLRTGLDDAITNVKGEGYAELKSKYASLKTIEKDVNKRAQIVARKTTGGLSFGDVFSAEEVVRGLATMNPQAIATGVGVKAATTLWKYFNNPDRYIASMFKEADRATNMGKIVPSPKGAQEQSQ
jgi:hypothetical protein